MWNSWRTGDPEKIKNPSENRQKSGLFWASPFTMHLVCTLLIFFSLTEAPLPDPTPTQPTPRKGPKADPKQTGNGPKCTQTDPKRTRNGPKSSSLGGTGRGLCRDGGGCKGTKKSGVAPANQTKERSVHELFAGAFRNKSSMWTVLVFLRKNTRIHKNGRNSWTFRFGPFFGLVCRGNSWKKSDWRLCDLCSPEKQVVGCWKSETGRIRFRGVRFQTPSSASFLGPHRVPGRELSEFLSAYDLCAKSELPEFFAELTEFAPELSEAQWVLFSETVLLKQYPARFLWKSGGFQVTMPLSRTPPFSKCLINGPSWPWAQRDGRRGGSNGGMSRYGLVRPFSCPLWGVSRFLCSGFFPICPSTIVITSITDRKKFSVKHFLQLAPLGSSEADPPSRGGGCR